jgi:hypothetical protein
MKEFWTSAVIQVAARIMNVFVSILKRTMFIARELHPRWFSVIGGIATPSMILHKLSGSQIPLVHLGAAWLQGLIH